MTPIVYLHGFASSPASSKARFFERRLKESHASVTVPQLDQGDFHNLTITGQLTVIDRAVAGRPAILMGSSLGGYLAALYASTHPSIERLVLLAPALRFPTRWRERHSPDLDRWKRDGSLPFFHYGANAERTLGYHFVEDALQYPDEPDFQQPALILHGLSDPVVPIDVSFAYAATHPNVQMRSFVSGHELTDVVEPIWREVTIFLGLPHVPNTVGD